MNTNPGRVEPIHRPTALTALLALALLAPAAPGCHLLVEPAAAEETAPTAPSALADPGGFVGDYCSTDAGCAWDDDCFPTRCVGVPPDHVRDECEESAPPPGECRCHENWCTLRPDGTATAAPTANPGTGMGTAPAAACHTDADCALDVSAATCRVAPAGLAPPIETSGPICRCEAAAGACRYEWLEPVPCESFRDCGYEREPRLHPVPATERRERPVQPCVDGEVDSVCDPDAGVCRVVAWSC